jgi:hypothetical protein
MKAIYSVITGGYDMLPVAPRFDGWDSIMFTDYPIEDETNGWIIRQLKPNTNPLVQSRDIKIRSHVHLPEYDLVCYVVHTHQKTEYIPRGSTDNKKR